jgi:hypothetical protein
MGKRCFGQRDLRFKVTLGFLDKYRVGASLLLDMPYQGRVTARHSSEYSRQ